MGKYKFVVLAGPKAGQDAEFEKWYDGQHLGDVCRVPGITGAERFRIKTAVGAGEAPWTSLAIYEFEGEDPNSIVEAITARAFTDDMPISDAMDMNAAQIIVEAVK